MKLTRLCKDGNSGLKNNCPAMYIAEDECQMVGQGKRLDSDTARELVDLADDEIGTMIPTETVLRAAGLFMAAHGRPAVASEIGVFLMQWPGSPS